MGSGKSFYAVRRIIDEVLETRRPVYTNLPLKFRVVRAYLGIRGGPDVVNLIRKLDERHWRAFLRRQHDFAKFRGALTKSVPADLRPERLQAFARANDADPARAARWPKFYERTIVAWFNTEHGPPIIDGPEANWIPPTSIICLDEVQHLHPMTKQKDDPSREDLLAYLTMIRHHLHSLLVITQDPSRIAIEFRLLARFFWRVWDPSESRLAGPIRFKHVGLKMMAYECMSREQMENYERDRNDSPVEKFYIWPKGTSAKVIYRLYSSHTNIGSARAMMRSLRASREAAGLDRDGHAFKENQEVEAVAEKPKRGMIARTVVGLRKLATISIVGAVAYTIGGAKAKEERIKDEEQQAPEILPDLEWPKWSGYGRSPYIGGRRIKEGEWISTRQYLEHIDPSGRKLVVRVDDAEWWLWEWPEPEPVRVGTIEDVRESVARLRDEESNADRQPVP